MARNGFSIERVISTLHQKPGKVKSIEQPVEGYRTEYGFTIIVGSQQDKSR